MLEFFLHDDKVFAVLLAACPRIQPCKFILAVGLDFSVSPNFPLHFSKFSQFIVLGASLHDVLTRLKAQPQAFPTIDVSYSPSEPLLNPIVVNLSPNGVRLRFDGPDQRLRLIEVLDFTKTLLTYKDIDLVKLPEKTNAVLEHKSPSPTGPAFRHVYDRLFGPTFPGEYIPPLDDSESRNGLYILSYPGVAFEFSLQEAAWSATEDFVSLLSSNVAAATSMGIFEGQSWQEARQNLMVRPCSNPRSLALSGRGRDHRPDEIELVKIRGNGRVDLERRSSPVFQVVLNETTLQDLVAELGPPDAIHRKYDRRLSIHRNQNRYQRMSRASSGNFAAYSEDTTDTDQSSNHAVTDESDDDEDLQAARNTGANISAECFYNYFHHGFDIFISYPTSPPPVKSLLAAGLDEYKDQGNSNRLVATKILLHANVPGSYPFNRYRRSRWIIDAPRPGQGLILTSETPFLTLSSSLQRIWRDGATDGSREDYAQKAMVLNRDWGDSPGSSCEILGDWEESTVTQRKGTHDPNANGGPGFGNTKLFGFPGLLFEVLKNDAVSCVTIY